ncbi:MAG TPA: MarR family winged helix-turn-helix transcriptional regulator [Polyangia bacterium]
MSHKQPRLYHLLARASHAVKQQLERRSHELLGIGTVQAGALFHLVDADGCLQKDLASALGILPSAVSGLVDRLEAGGLVQRRGCGDDGRAERLHATVAGRRVAARAKPLVAEMQAILSSGFSEAEIAIVARFLTAAIEREWPASSERSSRRRRRAKGSM